MLPKYERNSEQRKRAKMRENRTGPIIFWIILAYLRAAWWLCSSFLAPVTTSFPDLSLQAACQKSVENHKQAKENHQHKRIIRSTHAKINAVVLGSRMRMTTAANRFGLYSAFRDCSVIRLRLSSTPTLHVDTMFLHRTAVRFVGAGRRWAARSIKLRHVWRESGAAAGRGRAAG